MLLQTITALKLQPGNASDNHATVLGYSTPGDGGGGEFYWDATATDADNSGTIFAVSGTATGRWRRLYNSAVNVKWFGAKGNGDDATISKGAAIAQVGRW